MQVKFVKQLEDYRGDAKLYKLEEPSTYLDWTDDGEVNKPFEYVVVSAAFVPFSGIETYLFPADESGVIDWGELPGSMRGTLDHTVALLNGGFEVVE